jgi:hypothetical protein
MLVKATVPRDLVGNPTVTTSNSTIRLCICAGFAFKLPGGTRLHAFTNGVFD